ncbi:SDR family oxidoreductase [Sphingomonas sanxanigenens]|uniref:Short-chain dehydrogenase n=1 Tax=Sphingomonas sanxanigenens DSM 19645 = NX02 TaxID=1123269 RepID=W0AFI3_9SPHN|nr:SDR family oxidoreductase [Sphingomonas sanxanigenens]AHE56659.1 hypothetical protein NX02_25260 [Sphingomonas sanxanigenens DSM 19645 = NX02]
MTEGGATARRAIFISGGGSGIGRATARFFAARGWLVGLGDIDERGMAETEALLPDGSCSCHAMDVRVPAQWDRALAAFTALSGGRLDLLFNNAGIALAGTLDASSPEAIERLVQINISGVIHGARAGFPLLAATPGSALVNTGSAAGIYGMPGLAVYAASKFAVRGLTEALELEWAPRGVRVRSIMPSFIDTPLLDAGVAGSNATARDKVRAQGLEFTPVEQVAEAVWRVAEGNKVHLLVGKTARRLGFAARWAPGLLRRGARRR